MEKTHNLSTFRTHANGAIESNTDLDDITRYWCGFESEKRTVGENQLQLRRIRVPNERIVFEDADNEAISFQDIMEQLPPLAELFGFKNRNTEYLRDLRKKGGDGVYVHS